MSAMNHGPGSSASAEAEAETTTGSYATGAVSSAPVSTMKRSVANVDAEHADVGTDVDRRVRQRYASSSASDPSAISNSSIDMNADSHINGDDINGDASSFSPSSVFVTSAFGNGRVTDESERLSDASSSSSSSTSSTSPASRLYRHALESIFSFFGLKEVLAALRVSCEWCATVSSMAHLDLTCDYAGSIRPVSLSRVSRHIAYLGGDVVDNVFASACFPRLLTLSCHVKYDGEDPFILPPTLTGVDIVVTSVNQQRVLEAVSRLPLLDTFALSVENHNAYGSFACLASCPNLRKLTMHTSDLTYEFVDDVRSLPHLTDLTLRGYEDGDELEDLFREPCQMPWKRIEFYETNPEMDSRHLELLARLPFLDTLNSPLDTERLDFLHQMPNLTYLDLFLADGLTNTPDEVMEALASCPLIQNLRLTEGCGLTDVHLNKLLPRLPALKHLRLNGIALVSLSFLAQVPMMEQLYTLHICASHMGGDVDGATITSPDELCHLQELRGLHVLKLICLSPGCKEVARERFHVPSQLMPWLESLSFRY